MEQKRKTDKTRHWQVSGEMGIISHDWEDCASIVTAERNLLLFSEAKVPHAFDPVIPLLGRGDI